jgi:hypothetical protein
MKKYEYKVLDIPVKGFFGGKVDFKAVSKQLNDLGEEGWEVVTMQDINMYEGGSRKIVIILKREK